MTEARVRQMGQTAKAALPRKARGVGCHPRSKLVQVTLPASRRGKKVPRSLFGHAVNIIPQRDALGMSILSLLDRW